MKKRKSYTKEFFELVKLLFLVYIKEKRKFKKEEFKKFSALFYKNFKRFIYKNAKNYYSLKNNLEININDFVNEIVVEFLRRFNERPKKSWKNSNEFKIVKKIKKIFEKYNVKDEKDLDNDELIKEIEKVIVSEIISLKHATWETQMSIHLNMSLKEYRKFKEEVRSDEKDTTRWTELLNNDLYIKFNNDMLEKLELEYKLRNLIDNNKINGKEKKIFEKLLDKLLLWIDEFVDFIYNSLTKTEKKIIWKYLFE